MTRNGKIARIPRDYRDELNTRLADGEPGKQLVAWLNSLPEVQAVLEEHFGGRPITEQNLSEWKQGGFEDWLRHQENIEWARIATEEAAELEGDLYNDGVPLQPLSDRIAPIAAMALGRLIRAAAKADLESGQARRELLEAVRELTALRARDHHATHLKMDLYRWAQEKPVLDKVAARRAVWQPLSELVEANSWSKTVSDMAKGMTPEQEEKFREFIRIRPTSVHETKY